MIIINAENQVLGRMASFAAKMALLGERVIVVNAEKALVSGKKEAILKDCRRRLGIRNWGNPKRGPYLMKRPDMFVRRTIRGMLPWSKNRYGSRGRSAFKNISVFIGIPDEEIKKLDKNFDRSQIINMKTKNLKNYLKVEELCAFMGWRKNGNVGVVNR